MIFTKVEKYGYVFKNVQKSFEKVFFQGPKAKIKNNEMIFRMLWNGFAYRFAVEIKWNFYENEHADNGRIRQPDLYGAD